MPTISPSTELTTIFTNIKSYVESALSFTYVDASRWVQFDLGIFPEGLKDRSYTIKIGGNEHSEFSYDIDSLSLTVEFTLDTANDNYLKFIPRCQEAMEDIKTSSTSSWYKVSIGEYNARAYDTVYFFDKIILSFNITILNSMHVA